ncbi:S66 peptidase family protein [Maribacter sp. 2307ULW6-5]|uniref:S66 peptidase family protein n=1 Tax=Maribacter sp. 2307ULW6-5 TaxID=3386275 RepID=UPI0039BCD1AF
MAARRRFFKNLLGISLAGALPAWPYAATGSREAPTPKLLPKPLSEGYTVGLIAPGYAFPEGLIAEVRELLTSLGYRPYHTERLLQRHGYFSNTDRERAADIDHMFANEDVDAILCIRGGYGCTRIMGMLDYDNIKAHPKPLIGFSDVTALLHGIYKETGLVCFHGPVGSTLDDAFSISSFQSVLTAHHPLPILRNAVLEKKYANDPVYERYVIYPGKATGEICGGSLTLINALVGTPHALDFTDKLVFIEDIDEAPYRMDRMLTQLLEGPTFRKAAGIVFGVCAGCNESTNPNSFSLKEVVMDRVAPLNIPAVYGMSFGHVKQNFTFPIGIRATLDTEKMTVALLEKYLSGD